MFAYPGKDDPKSSMSKHMVNTYVNICRIYSLCKRGVNMYVNMLVPLRMRIVNICVYRTKCLRLCKYKRKYDVSRLHYA